MKLSKKKKQTLLAVGITATALTLGITVIASGGIHPFAGLRGLDELPNQITLDSANKVTSNGDKVIKTAKHNDVTFTYSGTQSSTTGHVSLSSGGSIVNKDQITSISSFVANFSVEDSLTFKVSYDGATWGGSTTLVNDQVYELSSNPYYIRVEATKAVTINSLHIEYTCSANPSAIPEHVVEHGEDYFERVTSVTSGAEYLIVCESEKKAFNGALTSLDATGNNVATGNITNGIISSTNALKAATFTITGSSGKYVITSKSGYSIGRTSNSNGMNTSNTSTYDNDISFSGSNVFIESSSGPTLKYNKASDQSRFRYFTSTQTDVSLFMRKYKEGKEYDVYSTPVDEVGFEASVSKTSYLHDEIFSEATLTVKSVKNDGSRTVLSKGNNGYSYVIKKQGSDTPIDATQAFGTSGTYFLEVSYKNYITQRIQLDVSNHVILEGISIDITKDTYNTADILSSYLGEHLTADLSFNFSSENKQISYSSFASNGLTVTLIDPNQVNHSISTAFGTAGTWKIKVASSTNSSIYDEVEITVNAIPVQNITLTHNSEATTSASIEEGDTLQLNANVQPNNATVQGVTWTSSNTGVATVSTTGLVTAKVAGTTTIKATTNESGSSVSGSCEVTVTSNPRVGDFELVTDGQLTIGAYVLFASMNSGSGIVMSTQDTSYDSRTSVSMSASDSILNRPNKTHGSVPFKVVEGATEGSYAFLHEGTGTGTGYLTAMASSNKLQTTSTLNALSSWTVTPKDSNGAMYVMSQGDAASKYLKPNTYNSNAYFSCYAHDDTASNKSSLYIFQRGGVVIYPQSVSMPATSDCTLGTPLQLTATFSPADTTFKNATWTSSDPTVATVTNGIVTGLKEGTTVITVTSTYDNSVTASCTVTVKKVAVTSLTVLPDSITIQEGGTESLTATISPSNATHQEVSWSSSNTGVATVNSNGVVTAVAEGTATITCTSVDNSNAADTCTVTVEHYVAPVIDQTYSISYTDLPTSYSTTGSTIAAASGINFVAYNCAHYNSSGKMQFKSGVGYIANTDSLSLYSLTINNRETNSLTVYAGTSINNVNTKIDGDNDFYSLIGYNFFKVIREDSGAAYCTSITVTTGGVPVEATGFSIPSTLEAAPGQTKSIAVTYTPENANTNTEIDWTSNKSFATVEDGSVTIDKSATVGQTATITAKLHSNQSVVRTCTVTVVESQNSRWTILNYICGADLESGFDYNDDGKVAPDDAGQASDDITEMIAANQSIVSSGLSKDDDVNIVIETGGAKAWKTDHGISKDNNEIYHISDGSLQKDKTLSDKNMGDKSTLIDFLEYGLGNYPADNVGVIFWNHGGAMEGCCYDEKHNDDSLSATEIYDAFDAVLSNGEKLEWIGYDCCLMQVQDIAEMNSEFFNYMIGSQESESGTGWDYDVWMPNLYNTSKSTTDVLKSICDSFIAENDYTYYTDGSKEYTPSCNDQTLAYLDLSKMSAYKTAFETLAANLKTYLDNNSNFGKTEFMSFIYNVYSFGNGLLTPSEIKDYQSWGYSMSGYDDNCPWSSSYKWKPSNGMQRFGTFDVKDFLTKMESNSSLKNVSGISNAKTALANLVIYSKVGQRTFGANGLCLVYSYSYKTISYGYSSDQTNFNNWYSFVYNYGNR